MVTEAVDIADPLVSVIVTTSGIPSPFGASTQTSIAPPATTAIAVGSAAKRIVAVAPSAASVETRTRTCIPAVPLSQSSSPERIASMAGWTILTVGRSRTAMVQGPATSSVQPTLPNGSVAQARTVTSPAPYVTPGNT